MDLQTISSQMKIVIQKHQMVVTEMRNDPQNMVLQKKLHDLQCEIQTLNERQKQIVEGLRKNLENKTIHPNKPVAHQSDFFPQPSQPEVPALPSPQKTAQNNHKPAPSNHKHAPTSAVPKPPPKFANSRPTVPADAAIAPRPAANTATHHHRGGPMPPAAFTFKSPTSSSPKEPRKVAPRPLLVVPSPASRNGDAGVPLNLVPPIRVPQYPPSPRASVPPNTANIQKPKSMSNCSQGAAVGGSSFSSLQQNYLPEASFTRHAHSEVNSSGCHSVQSASPQKLEISEKKREFITALGLVTHEQCLELRNKRLERKRRTTANPHFSNAALEEKWRLAAAALAAQPPNKRPRGRPRLEKQDRIENNNDILDCRPEASFNFACQPETAETQPRTFQPNGLYSSVEVTAKGCHSSPEHGSTNCNLSSSSSPASDTPLVANGIHKSASSSDEGKNVEQLLSGLCLVCTQPGSLVKCRTCAKQQHPACMRPPLVARPDAPWQCGECRARADALSAMHNYDLLKAGKEDDKRKLLKQSLELRLKRSQLEGRLGQLKELNSKQRSRQAELQSTVRGTEKLLEKMQNVIATMRQCS